MATHQCRRAGLAAVIVIVAASLGRADAPAGITLRLAEQWSTHFGGQEISYHLSVITDRAVTSQCYWQLTNSSRVLTTQRTNVRATVAKPAAVKISFQVPDPKPSEIIPIGLRIELAGERGTTRLDKKLWIYPKNPFATQKRWLKSLRITLFDPEGKTAAAFDALEIPFETIRNLDVLDAAERRTLLIGSGVSFRDYRSLWRSMTAVASQGTTVLCLAPSGGEFTVPGTTGSELPRPTAFALKEQSVIRVFDKRLDATSWPGGPLVQSRIKLQGERGRIVGVVGSENGGWPWLESEFPKPGGRLIVCGFGIVERWNDGPTPRYLLLRLLQHLQNDMNAEQGPLTSKPVERN